MENSFQVLCLSAWAWLRLSPNWKALLTRVYNPPQLPPQQIRRPGTWRRAGRARHQYLDNRESLQVLLYSFYEGSTVKRNYPWLQLGLTKDLCFCFSSRHIASKAWTSIESGIVCDGSGSWFKGQETSFGVRYNACRESTPWAWGHQEL